MVKYRSEKVIVHIIYPCFVCAEEFSAATLVIHHVKSIHGYVLIPCPTGHHRPQGKHYDYESNLRNKWDVQHYGCPSCWYNAPKNMESIMQHVMEVHEPKKIEGFVHKGEDDEDELVEEESDQEVVNKEKRVSFQKDIHEEEEEHRSVIDVIEREDGTNEAVEQQETGVENDVNNVKKDNGNSESRNNNENSSSPELTLASVKTSLLQSEQEFMKQMYEKLTDISISFKNFVEKTTIGDI